MCLVNRYGACCARYWNGQQKTGTNSPAGRRARSFNEVETTVSSGIQPDSTGLSRESSTPASGPADDRTGVKKPAGKTAGFSFHSLQEDRANIAADAGNLSFSA
jgi:hypothetical protein